MDREEQTQSIGKTPPHHFEAERAVLGAMMLSEDCQHDILQNLTEKDFYSKAHLTIFAAIRDIASAGQEVDSVLVCDFLKKQNTLDKVGGSDYVGELTLDVPTLSNANHYANIIRDKSLLRKLLGLTMQIQESIFQDGDVDTAYEVAESNLMLLSESRSKKTASSISDLMTQVMEEFNGRLNGDETNKGLSCHYRGLMKLLIGFRPGEMLIIAARPAMGKTSFALNLMLDMAIQQNVGVAFFSLEMPAVQIANNLVCIEAGIDGNFWRNPSMAIEEHEADQLSDALDRLKDAKLVIDDEPTLTPITLYSKLRRYVKEHDVKIAVIDYLQLMTDPAVGKKENRTTEMSSISRSIKRLSKELDIPIIALAQLNRGVETRADNKPKMSDLRESGSIEQDADAIMLIHRPEYYKEDDRPGEADVILAKNRYGSTGTIPLDFVKNKMQFNNPSSTE